MKKFAVIMLALMIAGCATINRETTTKDGNKTSTSASMLFLNVGGLDANDTRGTLKVGTSQVEAATAQQLLQILIQGLQAAAAAQ